MKAHEEEVAKLAAKPLVTTVPGGLAGSPKAKGKKKAVAAKHKKKGNKKGKKK